MHWMSSFIQMTGLPSLCSRACFQRTRKCCWPSPRGSGGSSGTTAGSELEVRRFCCCCSPPPGALIRPSIRSSAAGRPTCCLCERQRERPGFSAKSSGAAGNKELQRRKFDSWNESNVCSLMPVLKLNRTRARCKRMTGGKFFYACAGTVSMAMLVDGKYGCVAARNPAATGWTGLHGAAGILEPGRMKTTGSPDLVFFKLFTQKWILYSSNFQLMHWLI